MELCGQKPSREIHLDSPTRQVSMAAPTNTLLIEGSFEELASELASFIDNVRHSDSPIQPEIAKLLEASRRDEVLRKLVVNASILNSATEKGQTPSNLLSH
jgi:translation initiation factor 3 subunit M